MRACLHRSFERYFYNKELVKEVNEKFTASEQEILKAQHNLMQDGFDGDVYGYEAAKLLSYLIEAAKESAYGIRAAFPAAVGRNTIS